MIVKELIEKLNVLPSNKLIVIDDADTNWLLHILEIKEYDKHISISRNYGDEYNETE